MSDLPEPVLLVRMHYNQFSNIMYPIECAIVDLINGTETVFYANTECFTETPEDVQVNNYRIEEIHGIPRNVVVDNGINRLPMEITAYINEEVENLQLTYGIKKAMIVTTSRQDYNYLEVCVCFIDLLF